MLSLTAALALIASLQAGPAQPSGIVWGQVRSETSGTPLRYAVVEIPLSGRDDLRTSTDENGIYILRNVPAGRRVVRATHIDHAPHDVQVSVASGGRLALDFALRLRPVQLPVVFARAAALPTARTDSTPGALGALGPASVHVLEASPGIAELGLGEMTRAIPGYEPIDPSDVLYVRGGQSDMKLVLLDGAPVYAPFHLGGLIAALDTDWLGTANLYLGGAPARFDGGLSYIMELESRSARTGRVRTEVGADMLSARGRIEGPLPSDAGFLIAGRAVHGFGAEPFFSDAFPYRYGDAIARFDVSLGDGEIALTGFWNEEGIQLDSTSRADGETAWGNRAASLRYRGRMLGGNALFTLSGGTFETSLPIGGIRPLMTTAQSARSRFAADFERAVGPVRLAYGASVDRMTFEYTAAVRGAEEDSVLLQAHGEGDSGGAYVDAAFNVMPGLRLRAGLRGDRFALIDDMRFAPRISLTLALGQHAAVTVAGGRYHQYVRAPEDEIIFVGSVVHDAIATPPLSVARASHITMHLAQDLGDAMVLALEGYYKAYDGLPSAISETAEASGVELWVRRNGERINGWLGYSLGWVWSNDGDDRYSADARRFAGRHLISAGIGGPTFGRGAFDVRVSYGSGLPYTAIPEPDNAAPVFSTTRRLEPTVHTEVAAIPSTGGDQPERPYLRIDARVEHTWSGELNGAVFDVTPYLKLLNALNRRDAIFYHYDRTPSGTELKPLASLPVLPVLGVEWRF